MKELKILTTFLVMLLFLLAGTSVAYAQTKGLEFSAENAFEYTQYISQKIGPRPAGSKGEQKAAQYIYYLLEQSGWKVKEQPFSKVVVQNNPLNPENRIQIISSQNIIAELPGRNSETVILGAHYDSADLSAPGALDNASGVGVLLELARVLGREPHQESYQFVFFGAEEGGLVGSEYFVSQADLSAVRWMINLDMVGTPLEIDVAGKTSAPPELIQQVVKIVKTEGLPFHLSRDFLVMTRDGTQGGNSDFSPFLDHGIPAVGLGISGRPEGFYHRPEDQIEKVSLQNIDRLGRLVLQMLQAIHPTSSGPRTWDSSYLPFQFGSQVFILSTQGLRLFFLGVLFFTVYLMIRAFKKREPTDARVWVKYITSVVTIICFSLLIVLFSGIGETLWQRIKGSQIIWFAHPGVFLLSRIVIGIALITPVMVLLKKLPLIREATFYWIITIVFLLFASTTLGLYRLDLAFPFLFWLLCIDLLYLWPNLILVLISPYFIYRMHWELLNSQQWISFYETIHQYTLLFTLIYAGLLLPVFFSGMYVLLKNPKLPIRIFVFTRLPAVLIIIMTMLGLGLVPSYTRSYPQTVRVLREWTGNQTAQYHILSQDFLPRDLLKGLNQEKSKSIYLPAQADKPPMDLESIIQDKGGRDFSLGLNMNYAREPYRVQIKMESQRPFQITQMDEFLPMSKLPRKIKLEGKQKDSHYELIIERTPPQKSVLQWSIKGDGMIHVTAEVSFADIAPAFTLKKSNLSVDYLEIYRSEFEF